MYSIGLVDIDTTHAKSFAGILQGLPDFSVTGVFDAGDVRSDAEVLEFCKHFGCQRFENVESLADSIDAAMVLSADWQVHMKRLIPLIEAGKPVFVDKPLAGSLKELRAFEKLVQKSGVPVLAGSGWRLNNSIQQAYGKFSSAEIDSVLAMMHNEYVYYGIHVVEMVLGLLGSGIDQVEITEKDDSRTILQFSHKRGAGGHILLQMPKGCFVYGITFRANGQWQEVNFGSQDIHRGVCESFAEMVIEQKSPLSPSELTEGAKVVLAGLQSWEQSRPVRIEDLDEAAEYGSAEFMRQYRSAR